MTAKISFIGVGQMAGAIIEGIVGHDQFTTEEIGLYDISETRLKEYAARGFRVFKDIPSLVEASGVVFLAVKPQDFSKILPLIKKTIDPNTLVVSIAAGITGDQIQKAMGFPCKVVLAMPNTPLLLGKGAVGLAKMSSVTHDELETVKQLFASVGVVEEVTPEQLSAVIPISGSSPAFIYEFANCIVKKAGQKGIPIDTAMNLFAQTLVGSAAMLTQSGKTPEELIKMVCSPGGTTIAGMNALEENGFQKAIDKAFDACIVRAKELSEEILTEQPSITVDIVPFNSPRYHELLHLREEILRIPLGLRNSEQDVENDPSAIHFVALYENRVVGTAQLWEDSNGISWIKQVAVEADLQKLGVGRKLMEAIHQEADKHGCKKIALNARGTAIKFYEKMGYRTEGELFYIHDILHVKMVRVTLV